MCICDDQGNVEQHDAIGMIPALLLNAESHHKVILGSFSIFTNYHHKPCNFPSIFRTCLFTQNAC